MSRRYIVHKTDRAAGLETWIHEQVKEFSDSLQGAEVVESNLIIRDPFEVSRVKYFNGFVSVIVRLKKKAPEFLTTTDEIRFWQKIREIAKDRFGTEVDASKETSYTSVSFSEPGEEELYGLTENKKNTLKEGLEKIKQYIKWHQDCVRRYEETVRDEHARKMNFLLNVVMTAE